MDEVVDVGASVERLFQSIQRKIASMRVRHAPADRRHPPMMLMPQCVRSYFNGFCLYADALISAGSWHAFRSSLSPFQSSRSLAEPSVVWIVGKDRMVTPFFS